MPEGDFGGERSDGPLACMLGRVDTLVAQPGVPRKEVAWGIPDIVYIVDWITRVDTWLEAARALLLALLDRLLSPLAFAMVWIEIALFVK